MQKVVIIDSVTEFKEGPYETREVLAKREAIRAEINSNVIPPQEEKEPRSISEVLELKKVKKEWNKIKTNFKEREALMREIISGRVPNWGSIKVSLSNR